MTWLTSLIATTASILVVCLPPVSGLAVYVAVLAWYPANLTIKLGTVDFSASRIVVLVLITKLLLRKETRVEFRLILLDKLIIAYFLCQIFSGIYTTTSIMRLLENRAGAIFDLVLPYFVVRMTITRKKDYLKFAKYLLVLAVPLAFLGLYQSITGYNVVAPLLRHAAWGTFGFYVAPPMRFGFYRANVTFPVHILFGLFFVMVASFCTGILYSVKLKRWLYIVGIALLGVGVFSSMSSGPILATLLFIVFIALYRWRNYWKEITLIVVSMCASVEIISNRHFYNVLGDFTFDSRTAWYRGRLIEVALFEGGMSGHWLFGYGHDTDPEWYEKIDGRDHTDIVNYYLLILSRFGIVALVLFLAIVVEASKRLVAAFRTSPLESNKWFVWCLGSGMFSSVGVFFTTSYFRQPETLFFMMIGFCGVMPIVLSKEIAVKFGISRRGPETSICVASTPQMATDK